MNADPEQSLYTAEQVRALDRHAIEELGIPGFQLMHRAATAALSQLRERWPGARSVLLLCGPGNNGGDAFLLGALARKRGLEVTAVALGADSDGDAGKARGAFIEGGGMIRDADGEVDPQDFDVLVDGLFGTGLSRAPEGAAARLIEQANASGKPVLALDAPSGLNADTGVAYNPCMQATATVTFVAHKRGMFTGGAADRCGPVRLDRLDLPDSAYEQVQADAVLLSTQTLPRRARSSHKGEHGHVLAMGGDAGTGGAIRMCGEAALRCGAGLVSVATRAAHISALNTARPELMAHAVENDADLKPLLERADVLAVGPGLGQDDWGRDLWQAALRHNGPMVLDADALNLLVAHARKLDAPCVLTPHPGEAARLLESTVSDIQADRFAAVRALAVRFDTVVVLKGSGSLVGAPDGRVAVCPWGNPGMASGGMGDVLTGVIAALLAQGLSPWQAACMGVGLHARAGDRAARGGERGLLASDLFQPLRELLNARPD